MTTKPAKKAGSDDPTGRDLSFGRQDRPVGHLWKGCVRTSTSHAEDYQCNAVSLSHSSPTTASTALAVQKRPAAPTPVATTGGSGGLPPTRPAEPHPTGRQRVRGKPQWRLNDCSWIVPSAVAQSTWVRGGCGAISCTCAKVTLQKLSKQGRSDKAGVWV